MREHGTLQPDFQTGLIFIVFFLFIKNPLRAETISGPRHLGGLIVLLSCKKSNLATAYEKKQHVYKDQNMGNSTEVSERSVQTNTIVMKRKKHKHVIMTAPTDYY